MSRIRSYATTLIAAAMAVATTGVGAVEPVKLRWASDHSGPPHPAGIAEVYLSLIHI